MARSTIRNSLNKSDNGKVTSSSAEMNLLDHSDYGLVFALVSNGSSNIVGLYDDLATADRDRNGFTNLPYGITPIEMAESIGVKRASKKTVKVHFCDEQTISKSLIKCTKVLYGNKTSA